MAEVRRDFRYLVVNPLFSRALDGDFAPPSDPNKGTHTLLMLASAGFEKGTEDTPTMAELRAVGRFGKLAVARYTPSWAPSVESATIYRTDYKLPLFSFVAGLCLKNTAPEATDALLELAYNTESRILNVTGLDPLELAVGPELRAQRQLVADRAQAFFDSVTI